MEMFLEKTLAEWSSQLQGADLLWSPIKSPEEVLQDPQVQGSGVPCVRRRHAFLFVSVRPSGRSPRHAVEPGLYELAGRDASQPSRRRPGAAERAFGPGSKQRRNERAGKCIRQATRIGET